jgi:hypothetical protein
MVGSLTLSSFIGSFLQDLQHAPSGLVPGNATGASGGTGPLFNAGAKNSVNPLCHPGKGSEYQQKSNKILYHNILV